jgi:hypothetical protein
MRCDFGNPQRGAPDRGEYLALTRSLFQCDDFTRPVSAARTFKRASSKIGLIRLNASKPQWRTASKANWAHSGCTIGGACKSPLIAILCYEQ